jgi:acyl-CoA synthetase (AMP-forming)/AMP-acid ligase II
VVSGGAKLDPRLAEEAAAILPRARITEYYGASELGFVTVSGQRDDGDEASVGHPFPGVDVAIRDGRGAPVADGLPGTVFVRSQLVCDGYLWTDDDRGLRRDGEWATVGDVGWIGRDGGLRLAGREGGMVVTGGLNVYPGEVEAALRRVDGIDEAVVTSVPDPYLGAVLVAVVSGAGAAGLTHADVMDACSAHLPRYKVPRRVYATRDWPLTASGKIVRRVVESWMERGDERIVQLDAS